METPAGTIFLDRKPKAKSREDLLREKIPTITDLPTKYCPHRDLLMIIPLPEQAETEGGIVLPDRSVIRYNEGHVVALGPDCNVYTIGIGDCVTWNPHDETKLMVENVSFILLSEKLILMRIPAPKKLSLETQELAIAINAQFPQEVCNELAELGHSPQENLEQVNQQAWREYDASSLRAVKQQD